MANAKIFAKGNVAAIQQSTPSTFQRLPAEISHQIYSYLLVSTIPIQDGQPRTGSVAPKYNIHPNILQTCRDIYNEALPILYQDNVFQFASWSEMYYYDKKPDVPALKQNLRCPYSASRDGKLCVTRRLSFPGGAGNRFLKGRMDVIPVSPSCVTVDKERVFGACHSFIGHFPYMKFLSSGFKPWKLAEGKAELDVFIYFLRKLHANGLRMLSVKGIRREPALEYMMELYIEEGEDLSDQS